MSTSLQTHELKHTSLFYPPLALRVCLNSCSLSTWCYIIISYSASTFLFCLRSCLASGSFPISWLFASGGQRIRASVLAAILPVNIHGWFPLGLTGLISWQVKGLSRLFSSTTVWKYWFFSSQSSLWSNSHIYIWLLGKTIALTRWTIVTKIMPLLLNMLSRFVIAFFQWATIF